MKRLIVVLSVAFCVAVPASAAATGTLDQQQTSVANLAVIGGPDSGGLQSLNADVYAGAVRRAGQGRHLSRTGFR